MSTVLLLSTADTDLLAARAAAGASYRIGNPTRVDVAEELPALARGRRHRRRTAAGRQARLGGRARARCKASGVPTVLLGGEAVPDAELMAESSVPGGCGRGGAAVSASRAGPPTSPSWRGSCPTPCC